MPDAPTAFEIVETVETVAGRARGMRIGGLGARRDHLSVLGAPRLPPTRGRLQLHDGLLSLRPQIHQLSEGLPGLPHGEQRVDSAAITIRLHLLQDRSSPLLEGTATLFGMRPRRCGSFIGLAGFRAVPPPVVPLQPGSLPTGHSRTAPADQSL